MWKCRKKNVNRYYGFSDIGDHLHYEEISSIFLIYRNLSEAKYKKDLHWVGEWDKTSEERHVLSTPFTTIPFVQPFLLYRRSSIFPRSIESCAKGNFVVALSHFPAISGMGHDRSWNFISLALSLSLSSVSSVCHSLRSILVSSPTI